MHLLFLKKRIRRKKTNIKRKINSYIIKGEENKKLLNFFLVYLIGKNEQTIHKLYFKNCEMK